VSLLDEVPVNNYYIRPIVYRSVPQLNFSDAMPVDVTILAVTIARDVDKPLTCLSVSLVVLFQLTGRSVEHM